MLNLPIVKNDLAFIKLNFSGIVRAIKHIEDVKLTLPLSLKIMENIIPELSNIQGDKGCTIKTKIP